MGNKINFNNATLLIKHGLKHNIIFNVSDQEENEEE
jgi:hypothetical protein